MNVRFSFGERPFYFLQAKVITKLIPIEERNIRHIAAQILANQSTSERAQQLHNDDHARNFQPTYSTKQANVVAKQRFMFLQGAKCLLCLCHEYRVRLYVVVLQRIIDEEYFIALLLHLHTKEHVLIAIVGEGFVELHCVEHLFLITKQRQQKGAFGSALSLSAFISFSDFNSYL